ncbi:MAG: hypothetical protein IIY36_00440 [Lachnospiraceae bacterium]|nr:hypothetical protein [Lachnospiraceae bacterium]
MFYRFREALARFMYGRYGSDQLNRFLIVIFFVVFIANIFARNRVLWIVNVAILVICYLRMFSKNITARQKENAVYLGIKARVLGLFGRGGAGTGQGRGGAGQGYGGNGAGYGSTGQNGGRTAGNAGRGPTVRERMEFKYTACPSCSQKLRVPRGKGQIEVRCPRCGTIFREHT